MSFVLTVSTIDQRRVISFYNDYKQPSPNEHIRFFAKTDVVTISLYHTGKLVFQGEDAEAEYKMWSIMLGEDVIEVAKSKPSYKDYYYPSIGSDEVGKGDVFGPLIICAAYLPLDKVKRIKALNIQDSKALNDETIRIVGKELINIVPYSVLTLHNEKYNELVRQGYNLNKMTAYLHNRAILNVNKKINGTPEVIMDQFAEERLYFRYLAEERDVYRNITFLTKAESKYASVAIASIIARYALLRQFDELSKEVGMELKKGAGTLVDAQLRTLIETNGVSFLTPYAKTNYKNISRVLNEIETDEKQSVR